jgi:transcriptional regulator with XRE-family HTH domain
MKKASVHRPLQVALAGLLRELRLSAGLSQADVAEQMGIAQTAISDLEICERRPDFFVISELCELYGRPSLDELMAEVKRRVKSGKLSVPRLVRKDQKK